MQRIRQCPVRSISHYDFAKITLALSVLEKELLFTLLDFMFPSPIAAGHSLNFIFAYLIYHPEVQKKAQEEIDRVVGRSRMPTIDDRKE